MLDPEGMSPRSQLHYESYQRALIRYPELKPPLNLTLVIDMNFCFGPTGSLLDLPCSLGRLRSVDGRERQENVAGHVRSTPTSQTKACLHQMTSAMKHYAAGAALIPEDR